MKETEMDELRQVVKAWDVAMNSADIDATIATYVDGEPMAMPPHTPAGIGADGIRAVFEGLHALGKITVKDDLVGAEVSGDLAVMHGTFALTIAPDEGPSIEDAGKWVSTCRRQSDGSWKTVHNIWNSDYPLPD